MPTARVNGCDFNYQVKGTGPDLVFIHGEIHGSEYWEHQLEEFSRDFRCLVYDRRGHAGSESTAFGYSVANQAHDLALLLDHLGMSRPVIVALAFGTTIATTFAIDYPERVRGLVIAGMERAARRVANTWRAGRNRAFAPPRFSKRKGAMRWWRCCAKKAARRCSASFRPKARRCASGRSACLPATRQSSTGAACSKWPRRCRCSFRG